jgi:hypothetical protein
VSGALISRFLEDATKRITNKRKMINVSRKHIENQMGIKVTYTKAVENGTYSDLLDEIFTIEKELEEVTYVKHILTSNKIWEVLVAIELNHNVNEEQGGRAGAHDAFDKEGNEYEYKVSKNHSWNFQDISSNVLNKYLNDTAIILAIVDKTRLLVTKIYSCDPQKVVEMLKYKLAKKQEKFATEGKEIRRLQVSLNKGDLKTLNAKNIY